MIYNAHRDAKKDPKGWTWHDVFPEWKEKTAAVEGDDPMLGTLMALVKATGGRRLKKRKRHRE